MPAKRVYLMDCGRVMVDKSVFTSLYHMGTPYDAPVLAALIETGSYRILFDAGLHPLGLTDPEAAWGARAKGVTMRPEHSLLNTLEELGLSVKDVTHVVISHLHWDHCGALSYFRDAKLILQRAEYRSAFYPDSYVASRYFRNHFDCGLNFELVEGSYELAEGVWVISTPGHTPGHQSLLVQLPTSTLILPGDAIPLRENLTGNIPLGIAWSSDRAMRSMDTLRLLGQLSGGHIICTHDADEFQMLRLVPEYYQ